MARIPPRSSHRRGPVRATLLLGFLVVAASAAGDVWAQGGVGLVPSVLAAANASLAPSRPKLLFDCADLGCDMDYLKRELAWVEWVRDRHDADVHVLLTLRTTGGGGTEAVFYVTRAHGGGPASDTLRVFARPEISDDEGRRILLRTLQVILARDLIERPEGEQLSVSLGKGPAPPASPARDPWNAWVVRLSADGYFNGQETFRSMYLYGSSSASRVVERSKLSFSTYGNYSEQRFDSPRFVGVQRGWGANARGVLSFGARWSAGGRAFLSSSRFNNQHLVVGAGPAVEYDFYPYGESSRRQLTLAWEVTGRAVRYDEVTLYGKLRETLWTQGLTAKLSLTQPWGRVGFGPDLSQYLHDASKYRVTLRTNATLNLVRGFSLNLNAYAARIRDQLSLPRGSATDDDVLLQQRQIATSYQYYASVGFSYTFGSRSNNVVNPRMEEIYGSF